MSAPAAAPSLVFTRLRLALREALRAPLWLWNPIVARDLRITARRKRTYLLRAGYLLVLLAVAWSAWQAASAAQWSGGASVASLLQSESTIALTLTQSLGWLQLVAVALLAPMLTASCVSEEVEGRTLDVLLMTPLSVPQIIVGKLVSRLSTVVILILLGMPMLLSMRVFGGFSLEGIAVVEVLTLTTAILGGSAGILMSAWEKRSWAAVGVCYMYLVAWWFLVPVAVAAANAWSSDRLGVSLPWISSNMGAGFLQLARHINPFFVLAEMTLGFTMGRAMGWSLTSVNIVNLAMSFLLLAVTMPLVRRRVGGRESAAAAGWFSRLLARLPFRRRKARNVDADLPGSVADLPLPKVSANPVLWRELHLKLFSSVIQRRIAALALLGLIIWYYVKATPWRYEEMHVLPVMIILPLMLLLACNYSTGVITQEKQSRSWDILLTTPLTPRAILWGKLLGVTRRIIPLALFLLAHFIVFAIFFNTTWWPVLHISMFLAGFCGYLIAQGVLLSLWCRKNMTATVMNFAVAFTLWAGIIVAFAMLAAAGGWRRGAEDMVEATLIINPFMWMVALIEPVAELDWNTTMRDRTPYTIPTFDDDLTPVAFTFHLALIAGIYLAVAVGMMELAARRFNAITGRAS